MFKQSAFVGCSFTYGDALDDRQKSFPSLLGGVNLGDRGASNKQIFENAVQALIDHQQVIVQWTESGRGHFTNADVPIVMQTEKQQWQPNFVVPKRLWHIFVDVFKIIQNDFDDFTNIKKYVNILDSLAQYTNKKVFYINGLMEIKTEYMIPPFTKAMKNYNSVLSFIDNEKNWINTIDSLKTMIVDRGTDGRHPGEKSHRLFADMIVQYVDKKDKE